VSAPEDPRNLLGRVLSLEQQVIDLLKNEVLRLRDQVQDAPATTFRSLRDDIPPHY